MSYAGSGGVSDEGLGGGSHMSRFCLGTKNQLALGTVYQVHIYVFPKYSQKSSVFNANDDFTNSGRSSLFHDFSSVSG